MTINDMMQKAFWDTDIPDHPAQAWEQGYQLGANAVLKEIEFAMSLSSGSEHVALEAVTQCIKNLKGGEE